MTHGLTLNQYQSFAQTTAAFPPEYAEEYLTLGLSSEVGEFTGKLAKYYRSDSLEYPLEGLLSELGDILWFVAMLANYLGQDLEEVARQNMDKLKDRQARGVIKGNGDNR